MSPRWRWVLYVAGFVIQSSGVVLLTVAHVACGAVVMKDFRGWDARAKGATL